MKIHFIQIKINQFKKKKKKVSYSYSSIYSTDTDDVEADADYIDVFKPAKAYNILFFIYFIYFLYILCNFYYYYYERTYYFLLFIDILKIRRQDIIALLGSRIVITEL